MKKLQFLLLIAGIILAVNGFSQTTGFDLSKYRLPALDRRELNTNFNLYGNTDFFEYPDNMAFGTTKTTFNTFTGNFSMYYKHYLNSLRYQREVTMGLDFSSTLSNEKDDGDLSRKDNGVSPECFGEFINRTYYRPKWFYETDVLLNYGYEYRKLVQSRPYPDNDRNQKQQGHQLLLQLPLKFGHGRIEQVQDARQALYIIDELTKAGRMKADLSDDQIIEFAALISKLKNKRYFDARLRRIADLESVDSFLVAKRYVNEQDIRYFTTLNDMWAYGDRPVRNSGTRISVAGQPGYYLNTFKSSGSGSLLLDDYIINAYVLDGGFELKHESPMSLYWQNTIEVVAYAGVVNGNVKNPDTDSKSRIKFPSFRAGYYQTFGYYPNTRTDFNLGYSVEYVNYFGKTDQTDNIIGLDAEGLKGAINLSMNYYISPQLRLNAYCYFYYIWQDSDDGINIPFDPTTSGVYFTGNDLNYEVFLKNQISNQFGIRLTYMIF